MTERTQNPDVSFQRTLFLAGWLHGALDRASTLPPEIKARLREIHIRTYGAPFTPEERDALEHFVQAELVPLAMDRGIDFSECPVRIQG